MLRILLVRHADTEWNEAGKIQGHVDSSLSERGLAQARALGVRLKNAPIDVAYTSDLQRAAETAQAIQDGRTIELGLVSELRELCYGEWEGMSYQEIKRFHPTQFADMMSRRLDFAPPGGESMAQLIDRVGAFVEGIQRRHGDATVLLVGHGASLRAAVICLLQWPRQSVWSLWMATASLSIVEARPDNSVLRLLNDTSHLSGRD